MARNAAVAEFRIREELKSETSDFSDKPGHDEVRASE
jgi:hypothetical protein